MMNADSRTILAKADWLKLCDQGIIRPYIFVRPDSQVERPGFLHRGLDWFPWEPIFKNPLDLKEITFAEQILHLENTAFGPQSMPIPRWVFYDCGIVPGFVTGFAMRAASMSPELQQVMKPSAGPQDWVPISLFIIIPAMRPGEWVAHNLCAVNSLLSEGERFYALGFLSKAFGLWYANIQTCCGMTQWGNPALKLHSHYGNLEILTAFTPVHSHAHTMTYRCQVDPSIWPRFFDKKPNLDFERTHEEIGRLIDPKSEDSMKELHESIISNQGPFYLSSSDIALKKLSDPLKIYRKRGG